MVDELHNQGRRIVRRFLLGLLFLGVLTCRQPFTLTEMLDEPSKQLAPLVISPSEATLYIDSSLTLSVSGGETPYSFSVSEGAGSVNEAGVYTAPSAAGRAVVTVTDAMGDSASAGLTVTDQQVNADYGVQSISNSPATFNAGDPIAQTFVYENTGADDGILTVYWNIYTSADTVLDGTDDLVDTGSGTALATGGASAPIDIGGNWPPSAGIYYLIVKVSSGDDTDPENNSSASASFSITSTGGVIDYTVSDVTRNYPNVGVGSLCSETFDLSNVGDTDGSNVAWTAYASDDQTLGGDELIASGTLTSLTGGSSVNNIPILGPWPSAGTKYLLVSVTPGDETAGLDGNNTAFNGTYAVNAPPDYEFGTVEFGTDEAAGTDFSGDCHFVIEETNNNAGTQPVAWEAFVSLDNVLDGGDESVQSGVISPLSAGGSSDIDLDDATWPDFGTEYFVIINIASGDDEDAANNRYTSPVTVEVPELIPETGGDNSSYGPVSGEADNVQTLTVTDGPLSDAQLVRIDGHMDASGEYDSYEITTDALNRLEVWAQWSIGDNAIDLYVWDSGYAVVEFSEATTSFEDPGPPQPVKAFLSGAGTYYVSVRFNANAVVDASYELFIQGR